jgi:hypothetical protein
MMNHKVISSIASLDFGNCELSATTKHQPWMPPLSAHEQHAFVWAVETAVPELVQR